MSLPLVKPANLINVLQVFGDKLSSIAQPIGQDMTYDQEREMMMHLKLMQQIRIASGQ